MEKENSLSGGDDNTENNLNSEGDMPINVNLKENRKEILMKYKSTFTVK